MFMILFCSYCISGVQTQCLYTPVMACADPIDVLFGEGISSFVYSHYCCQRFLDQ